MPYSLYLDIDSPTLAQTFAYDGYSSGNASATKSTFSELSPQRWPVDCSAASFDFDFDPDDEGENPFVYDIEASSKGMALPAPPPLSPENIGSIASPLFSSGIRRGPLSYYGSIFGYGHGLADGSKTPAMHFTVETNDRNEAGEPQSRTQVSPLTPSIECFGMAATHNRPVSSLPPTHPPTPAMQRFQIAVNTHNQSETSYLNFSPVPSLDSDSVAGSPRLSGVVVSNEPLRPQLKPLEGENNVDIGWAEERDGVKVVLKSTLSPFHYSCMHSPSTSWLPQSAFSLSSDEGSHFEDNECRSSYSEDGLTNYTGSLYSGTTDDEELNCDTDHISLELSSGHQMGGGILGYDNENTAHYASNEDAKTCNEELHSNSNTHRISDCHKRQASDCSEYRTLCHQQSFVASPDHREMFDQLGIALPLPPPSVQAPTWAGPQGDLKTLIHEHLEATEQLKPEGKHLDPKPVINNHIHFTPLADLQISKSDPESEGNADMSQWLPSPETPTFGIRLTNRVKAILNADKQKKTISENRNSVRTQKLLDEGFKSASLYMRRKRVDRANIGAPVGPAVIEHDSNTQKLVAMAEEWKNQATERVDANPPKPNGLTSLSTVSLPSMTSVKRVETFETDDDISSVDDAFAVHTPLRPRGILPDLDQHRRSHSLPGAFTFTTDGIHTGAPMTLDRLRNRGGHIDKIGKEKEVVEKEAIDPKGEDGGKDERHNMGEEEEQIEDSQATAGQQWPRDVKEVEESKTESLFTSEPLPSSPLVTSISNQDTLHEQTGHTLVYEDVLFELIPQRTVSGTSIWLGSDTVSSAGSSRENSSPTLWQEPQEVTPAFTMTSTTCSETPPPASQDPSNSVIQHTPPKLEHDSPVQARLIIGPATEIFIPVLLEDAYGLNAPPPRVIYEETPQSDSSGILPATVPPPQLVMPPPLLKTPVLRRTTTLCSPGVGKTNQSHVPLRQRSISKPLVVSGLALPTTNNDLDMDPAFMVPTRRPPLPLRRPQSQAPVRTLPSTVPSRRPSDGDIISIGSLDSSCLARELHTSSLSSQNGGRNRGNGVLPETNILRLAPAVPPSKAPLYQNSSLGASGDQPQELRQRLEKSVSGSRRLAPASSKVTLPSSPRPVKGIKSIPSPISISTHNRSFEQALADEDRLKSPVTPLTGKLIYSAPEHFPLPVTMPRRTSPVLHLSQYPSRTQSRMYVYIPYTIPRIGGGVIEREHRLKLATGRAAKRARTCKGCATQGGGVQEVQMWFCLEVGCGWELCEACVTKKSEAEMKLP